MEDSRRQSIIRVCENFLRGIISADETCKHVIFSCDEPNNVAAYLQMLPVPVLDAVTRYLRKLPISDDEWVNYEGICMIDGDEYAWEAMIVACRTGTEAIRVYFGITHDPESSEFRERVRAAYRHRMSAFD